MDPAVPTEAKTSQNRLTYVLITPARNEAVFIKLTIQSVIKQTVLPLRWIIVSDGSTDGTDDIVRKYAARHDWIELLRMPERKERHFGGKVLCFNAGYSSLVTRHPSLCFDIVGNLDADISFEGDLFAFLLSKFTEHPKLGVAGVPFTEGGGAYDFRFSSIEHVSGQCQLFRRECFEAIGGYIPLKLGGIDVVAVLSARMKGWQTRTFTEKFYVHHRLMGTAKHGNVKSYFKLGEKDYTLGRHPLWQVCRAFYQTSRPPVIFGGALLLTGYFWAMVRRIERPLPAELIPFQRREQMQRLKEFVSRHLLFRKRGDGASESKFRRVGVAKIE
jgi:biofilm PGA synthesis N-glycosyltransferase PgaC